MATKRDCIPVRLSSSRNMYFWDLFLTQVAKYPQYIRSISSQGEGSNSFSENKDDCWDVCDVGCLWWWDVCDGGMFVIVGCLWWWDVCDDGMFVMVGCVWWWDVFGYVSESNTSASCGNCEYGTHVLNFVCQLSKPSIVSHSFNSQFFRHLWCCFSCLCLHRWDCLL